MGSMQDIDVLATLNASADAPRVLVANRQVIGTFAFGFDNDTVDS